MKLNRQAKSGLTEGKYLTSWMNSTWECSRVRYTSFIDKENLSGRQVLILRLRLNDNSMFYKTLIEKK